MQIVTAICEQQHCIKQKVSSAALAGEEATIDVDGAPDTPLSHEPDDYEGRYVKVPAGTWKVCTARTSNRSKRVASEGGQGARLGLDGKTKEATPHL